MKRSTFIASLLGVGATAKAAVNSLTHEPPTIADPVRIVPTTKSGAYEPFGAAKELFTNHDSELVISGPSYSGKTRACLEKCNMLLEKYPHTRGLMIGATLQYMYESCIITFEEYVLPTPTYIPFNRANMEYRYLNDSKFMLVDREYLSRITASDFDFIYIHHAEQFTESEWEILRSRLSGRRIRYPQLIGDVNPSECQHWIKEREKRGELTLLQSRHVDNPVMWDHQKQEWTEKGRAYIDMLNRLTGVRKKRLLHGQWC